MPHEVTVCPHCRRGYVRFSGVVTGKGLLRVLYDIQKSGTWDLTCDEVWDLRAARDVFIKPAEADRLSQHVPDVDADPALDEDMLGRTALIVRTTSHKAYGIVLCRSLRPYNRVHRSFFSARRAARWLVDSTPRSGLSRAPAGCEAECGL